MPPDSYKIEVIHFLNPHLIWIVVRDTSLTTKDEIVFEQVGLYGILPQEKTLDLITEEVKTQKSEEWLPAATSIMKKVLDNSVEIYFAPTHIDRRVSIFDDNIHKYGEIVIKTVSGKYKKITKHLVKSGFAYVSVGDFHEKLSCGKLKTKLTTSKTEEIIKVLANFYGRKNGCNKNWKKAVEKHTSVFQMSQNLESSLTISNLEKHNNMMVNKTLENKFKDFELCKDVEEPSLGRACARSSVESNNSGMLQRKLAMEKMSLKDENVYDKTLDDIRKFLDANSNIAERNSDVCNKSVSSPEIDTVKKDHNESFLSRKLIYLKNRGNANNAQSCHKKLQIEKRTKRDTEMEKSMIPDNNHVNKNVEQEATNFAGFQEGDRRKNNVTSNKYIRPQKSQNKIQVAFGPPGIDYKKLKIQVLTAENNEDNEPDNKNVFEGETALPNRDCIFGEVDSELNIKITNKASLNNCLKKVIAQEQKEMIIKNQEDDVRNSQEVNLSDCSVGKRTSSTSSLFLQRKIQAHNNSLSKHDNSFSGSDISNRNTSNIEIPTKKSSDDEEDIEELMERLNMKYKDDLVKKEDKLIDKSLNTSKLKNNVNPFMNVDPSISVFVDKLVKDILMVHSKHDRRIQAVPMLRDIYFNAHIHNILINMSIEHPMRLQKVSWFTILRGYSLFMISPLGSGKTLGYLPAVCRLVNDSNSDVDSVGPIAIIVCATAKSVANVEKMAKIFLRSEEKVLSCYAGVDNFHVTTKLLNGCDLLISTPSFLLRLLQFTDFGVDLRRLSTFVLDDCERLGEVYLEEIRFFIYKIRQTLKNRANKPLKVQYILASRIWCDFMEPLVAKVPDSVICIGAFQECVLYSKSNTSVCLVKNENKIDCVFDFLKEINASKKTVIVCQSNEEVNLLEKALKRSKHVVFACDNNMTIHDLYNLSVSWADFDDPLIGPVLICCDSNLTHMNIIDAHNLIHYSLPSKFSLFCKRFSVLNDSYPSIFKQNNDIVKIKVFLDEDNVEQLPKILNFVRRCTDNVPDILNEVCTSILRKKDLIKAENLHPICDNLLTFGYCPDFYNCQERHTILKDYDTPKDWLPKEGDITCKILHYHSAILYSAKLLSCTVNGVTTNYPQTYGKLSLEMGLYYSKECNRKLHGIPKIGDICTTNVKLDFYVRCQVVKILSTYQNGNPNRVLVKLIDEEILEISRDIYLYHLPEHLKGIESRVVQIRLANIEPKDKDTTFSDLAKDSLKKIIESDAELYVRGNVSLTLGNCIFVNTLEAYQHLTSLNEVFVKCDLKRELLQNHAIYNPEQLTKIEKLCIESGLFAKRETKQVESKIHTKILPTGTWAHLTSDNMSRVFFGSAISPEKFFVRLVKFESCMTSLIQDIEKYVDTKPPVCVDVKEGDIVLAEFPDDSTYERARIDCIKEDKAKCFFVDQGDWREVSLNNLLPIPESFINQLPFQAIECRLFGVKPLGEQWTDFSTNWFCDSCYMNNGDLKQLFVKYFTKEPAEFTKGHKYSIRLIDTSTDKDVDLNQLMIDLNLAQEYPNEIIYVDDPEIETKPIQKQQPLESEDDDWEAISVTSPIDLTAVEKTNSNKDEKCIVPSQTNILFKPPIRSVPLVDSDNESDGSDKWDINIDDSFGDFIPALKAFKSLKPTNLNTTVKSTETHHKENKETVEETTEVNTTVASAIAHPILENSKPEETIKVKMANLIETNQRLDESKEIEENITVNTMAKSSAEHPRLEDSQSVENTNIVNIAKIPETHSLDIIEHMPDAITVNKAKLVETYHKPEGYKPVEIIELDSDDLTSPDNTTVSKLSAEKPILTLLDQKRRPKLVWRQNKNSVIVKIQLVGADNYKLDIEDRVLNFNADLNDTEYAFRLELYGVVERNKCSHMNKGQYILVKLTKVLHKNWLSLTRDGTIKKWIVYDVDSLDTSSDDDSVDDITIKNIVRNMHNTDESDSDEDFIEDVCI